MIDFYRQKEGVYCLHGAAVSYRGQGIWFMGPISGIGKTTLALNLCLKDNFKFISDEKILINYHLNIIGGIKRINYNKEFLKKSVHVGLNNKDEIQLGEILKIESGIVPLSLGIVPIIIPNSQNVEIDQWGKVKIDFHVYEELSRKIRGISRRVNNYTTPVDSVGNVIIAQKRSTVSKNISNKIPFYIIKGTETQILKQIMSNFN